MEGTWMRFLVRELRSTCLRATKPMCYHWASELGSPCATPRAVCHKTETPHDATEIPHAAVNTWYSGNKWRKCFWKINGNDLEQGGAAGRRTLGHWMAKLPTLDLRRDHLWWSWGGERWSCALQCLCILAHETQFLDSEPWAEMELCVCRVSVYWD